MLQTKGTTLTMTIDRIALPTENYEPYYRTLRAFTSIADENRASIARIARLVDTQLAYPETPHKSSAPKYNTEENEEALYKANEQAENASDYKSDKNDLAEELVEEATREARETNVTNDDNVNEVEETEDTTNDNKDNDCLREYLDNELCVGLISVELPALKLLQNETLRQLFLDNYRLARMKQLKLQKNRVLLQVLQAYEALMTQVILPRLSEEVMGQNLRTVNEIRDVIFPERSSKELSIWSKYLEYSRHLDQIRKQVHSIGAVVAQHTDLPEANRLGAELGILERLLNLTKKTGAS